MRGWKADRFSLSGLLGGTESEKVHSRRSAAALGMRLWDLTWRNGRRGEDLQLAYLTSCLEQPVGTQGAPVGVGGWGSARSMEREVRWRLEDKISVVHSRSGKGEGRPQQ